jgi:hypothetical protein
MQTELILGNVSLECAIMQVREKKTDAYDIGAARASNALPPGWLSGDSALPVFCRPVQCSLTNSCVDDNSCLISEYLALFILHDVFASRHLHITML